MPVTVSGMALNREYVDDFPLARLVHHPKNTRRGDVQLIAKSLRENEQYKPLTVQRRAGDGTEYVVCAGNHTLDALLLNGETNGAVLLVDVDDDQGMRILIVDNRANDVATNDEQGLSALLAELERSDRGLAGTGYDQEDLTSMVARLNAFDGHQDQLKDALYKPAVHRDVPVRPIQSNSNPAIQSAAVYMGWHHGVISTAVSAWFTFARSRTRPPRLMFMDNDWREYNHARHLAAIRDAQPIMATVRDLVTTDQAREAGVEYYSIERTLELAADVAALGVEDVILIPKYNCMADLPRKVGDARVVLGYSVPSSYGATPVDPLDFRGWPIHLLGGPWPRQRALLHLLGNDVVSFDNNNFFRVAEFGNFSAPTGEIKTLGGDLGIQGRAPGRYIAAAVLSLLNMMTDLLEWGATLNTDADTEQPAPAATGRDGDE